MASASPARSLSGLGQRWSPLQQCRYMTWVFQLGLCFNCPCLVNHPQLHQQPALHNQEFTMRCQNLHSNTATEIGGLCHVLAPTSYPKHMQTVPTSCSFFRAAPHYHQHSVHSVHWFHLLPWKRHTKDMPKLKIEMVASLKPLRRVLLLSRWLTAADRNPASSFSKTFSKSAGKEALETGNPFITNVNSKDLQRR